MSQMVILLTRTQHFSPVPLQEGEKSECSVEVSKLYAKCRVEKTGAV